MKSCRFVCAAAAFLAALVFTSARAATLTLGDATLSGDQLTVPVTVSGAQAGDLKLYIGEAGPRDGEPTATAYAATLAITGDGSYNLTAQISVGAKIAYKAVLGSDESASDSITATDNVQYIWVNNATGNWHDPANWTRDSNDGYKNIGYPAYTTGNIRFFGNQTAEVTLDADYSGIGDMFIDNSGLNLTIHGNGKELRVGNTRTAGSNVHVTLDNLKFYFGGYMVTANSSLTLENGAYAKAAWHIKVNGTNALLYVGSGCQAIAASWDENLTLDGEGASIVIDDGFVETNYGRIGMYSTSGAAAPYGFVFKGASPRLQCSYELEVKQSLNGNVKMEFFVPSEGFSRTPVYLREGGDGTVFPRKSDNGIASPKIDVTISRFSPFYQGYTTADICLVDWSVWSHLIDPDMVVLESLESPTDNYEYYTYLNDDDSKPNKIWAHLTGTGTPSDLPTLSATATAAADSSTAIVTISGSVESFASSEYDTQLELWVATLGPKDDPATATLAKVDTKTITAAGNVSFDYAGTLGSKIAYKLVLTADNGTKTWECGATAVQTIVLKESSNVEYVWTGGGSSGAWSDPANWSRSGGDNSLLHIGYPTWGAKASFYSTTSPVVVDADYEMIGTVRMGDSGSSLTFKSDDPSIVRTIEASGLSTRANIAVTLDGVVFGSLGNQNAYPGSYSIGANSSLSIYNGGGMEVRWEFVLAGENARLYVGTNCTVKVSASEPYHRLELSGANAEIVIDGGTVDALFLGIAGYWKGSEHDQSSLGDPAGITFSGKNPLLKIDDHMGDYLTKVYGVTSSSPAFRFVIPEGGYDSTPIVRYGRNGTTLFAQSSADIPAVKFVVDRSSPYLKARGDFTQQLLDWSSSTADPKLNTEGVSFANMPRDKERMYFTPESGDTKSGIAVDCKGRQGLAVVVR